MCQMPIYDRQDNIREVHPPDREYLHSPGDKKADKREKANP